MKAPLALSFYKKNVFHLKNIVKLWFLGTLIDPDLEMDAKGSTAAGDSLSQTSAKDL